MKIDRVGRSRISSSRHSIAMVIFRVAAMPAVAALCLGGMVGCASSMADKSSQPSRAEVVRENEPQMTPAQRDARYREAFADGMACVQRGQYGPALAAFEEATRLKPDADEALFNLAACHEAVGDPLRAIQIYKALVGRSPQDPDCYTNLGTSYIKMFYREKTPSWRDMALEAWRRSLVIRPDQAHVLRYIAQAESSN